jgi:hypothetical protein
MRSKNACHSTFFGSLGLPLRAIPLNQIARTRTDEGRGSAEAETLGDQLPGRPGRGGRKGIKGQLGELLESRLTSLEELPGSLELTLLRY